MPRHGRRALRHRLYEILEHGPCTPPGVYPCKWQSPAPSRRGSAIQARAGRGANILELANRFLDFGCLLLCQRHVVGGQLKQCDFGIDLLSLGVRPWGRTV
jgi:hypothetical protein